MKNLTFIILIASLLLGNVAFASPHSVALIQNSAARDGISLDGQWSIIIDPYENGFYSHRYEEHPNGYFKNLKPQQPLDLIEYDFATAQKVQVPGDWNTQDDKLFLYEGTVWYQKDFALKKKSNKKYVIHFGAVNYLSHIYVNGTKVGSNEGGFTPFQFDITDQVKKGDNFIVLKVDNKRARDQIPTVNTDWWNYGGITRAVKIMELDDVFIADYSITYTEKQAPTVSGWVQLNASKAAGKLSITIPELDIEQVLKADGKGRATFSFDVKPQLWSPSNPKLYDVKISHANASVDDKVGFRTIATNGTDIQLNGESIFLRGISLHEETPLGDGRAWSEEEARTLLGWAKALGCNFVRLAHYPHNENMIRVADEMGLLLWSEIPVYWTILFKEEYVYQKAETQLVKMIERDKNRASVILWSVANETPGHADRLKFLTRLVKKANELDDTRLTTAALDTQLVTKRGRKIDDALANEIDVIGINTYCGWYYDRVEDCSKWNWESGYGKPIIVSEFGAGALQGYFGSDQQRFTEEHQALVYKHNLDMLDNISALRGVTPWILKDFRSPRRQLANIQDFWNRKGLLSEKGIRKQAWYVLRDWYDNKEATFNKK